MFLTTPLFNQIVDQDPSVLANCVVVIGGEALSARHVATGDEILPASVFVNGYGPTENTTFSTTHRIDREYSKRIPIGRPIANSTAYERPRWQAAASGVPGELHVGGDGSATAT